MTLLLRSSSSRWRLHDPGFLYMGRWRKIGFITGAIIGASGGALAPMPLSPAISRFLRRFTIDGQFQRICHYFRFAAADVATAGFRSKAISCSGRQHRGRTLGPTLRGTQDLLPAPRGVYTALIVVYLAVATIVSFINIPRPTPEQQKSGVGLCSRLLASLSLSSRSARRRSAI